MTQTVEVKVVELTGAALDWAVAITAGEKPVLPWWGDGTAKHYYGTVEVRGEEFSPSSDWAQGGLIVESGIFELKHTGTSTWSALTYRDDDGSEVVMLGDTALVAVCRAFVASKHGKSLHVPAELAGGAS